MATVTLDMPNSDIVHVIAAQNALGDPTTE